MIWYRRLKGQEDQAEDFFSRFRKANEDLSNHELDYIENKIRNKFRHGKFKEIFSFHVRRTNKTVIFENCKIFDLKQKNIRFHLRIIIPN